MEHQTTLRLKVAALFLFILLGSQISAQDNCEVIGGLPEEAGVVGDCSDYFNYVPYEPSYFPILRVRIMVHVFQNSVGNPLNFQAGDEPVLLEAVDRANQGFAALQPLSPNPYGSIHVPDSRVRVVLDPTDVRYVVDQQAWQGQPSAGSIHSTYVTNNPDLTTEQKQNYLHFLVFGTAGNCAVGGATPYFGSWIRFGSWWCATLQPGADYNAGMNEIGNNMRHELGHNLGGLVHVYEYYNGPAVGDQCADTPDCADGTLNDPTCQGGQTNNIVDQWQTCRCAMSECQLGRLHKELENRPNLFRRIIEDYCTYDPNATVTIQSGQVVDWSDKKELHGDLIVKGGAQLTVQCQVHLPYGAKVVVEPNGKLVIQGGGKLTNLCGQFWSGIEVWGTSNQHQYPADHPTYQGLVILRNGATIEHAREAIRLWKPDDWNSMGGVVQVKGTPSQVGAYFINCRRSAEFMKYENFQPGHPSNPRTNLSSFAYAQFKVDDGYRGGDDFEGHVSMWGVDGINFRACTFENAQTNVPYSERLGEGILSLDANYSVSGNCTVILPYGTPCPGEDLDRGSFTGLGNGIYSLDGGSGRGFTASNLDFNNNVVGLYAEGIPGFTAVRNRFTMGDRFAELTSEVHEHFQEPFHRGISTQKSHGFRIEENSFDRATNVQAAGLDAIVVENSGSNSTQVYKNSATGMNGGYIAEGNCMDPLDASAVGHEFVCNTNATNEQNFWVRKDYYDDPYPNTHSLRTQQGSNDVPAGNTFDQGTGDSDYKNEASWVINYWHKSGVTEPIAVTPGWVGVTLATGTNNCQSRLSGKQVKMNAADMQQVQAEFNSSKSAYTNTAYVYHSLLDGGNTPAVVQEVEESWPQDAWNLRNYLMSKSPYLSTQVLQEMMRKNILPQAMVLEICLANPEATKKEGFTKWAENEAPSPLPGYMIDLIAGSWAPKTFRMELEAQVGQHHAAMSVAADLVQASYRAEEETIPLDAMLNQWNAMPNYGARFAEAELLMRKGQYDAALTMIQALGDRYPLKEGRETERDRTVWYIDQLQALKGAGRSIMQLDATELAQWQAFAEMANDIPGNWVANVLCFGYKICVKRTGTGGPKNKTLRPTTGDTATEQVQLLGVAPNPAGAWAAFNHTLTAALTNAHVRVVDASGREVANLPINAQQGQLLWDTREVPAGLYNVELFNGGVRLATERLVVQPFK